MKKITAILLLIVPCTIHAQEGFTTKSLSIFKNGQSFVIKEGKVSVNNNVYKINTLPNALFGTYWFYGISNPITSVTSRIERFTEKQQRNTNSFLELLHANQGKQITVATNDDKTFQGTVEDFDLPEEINSKMQLQQMDLSNSYQNMSFDKIFYPTQTTVLLKLSDKWVSIDPASIKRIEFAEKPNRILTANISVQKPIVSLNFNQQGGEQTVRMMYLQEGLSWTPTYKLQLLSETEARLDLQAEVSNDVEDIKNADIDFVAGVPNFSQATSLATLLNFSNHPLNYPRNENYSNAYQYSNASAKMEVADAMIAPAPNIVSAENEDLYFYTIKNITLGKNSRAQFPVFSYPVKIRHYYKGSLPASSFVNYSIGGDADNNNSNEQNNDDNKNVAAQVSHYIEITNSQESPFTSGPILITQGSTNKALAQSQLSFTGKGTSSSFFVTNSPDIVIKEEEKLINTSPETKKINEYDYSLITIKSTVTVTNTKSKPISIQLDKIIDGKLIDASIKNSVSKTTNANNVNSSQKILFQTNVEANNKTTFTYTYRMYVR